MLVDNQIARVGTLDTQVGRSKQKRQGFKMIECVLLGIQFLLMLRYHNIFPISPKFRKKTNQLFQFPFYFNSAGTL